MLVTVACGSSNPAATTQATSATTPTVSGGTTTTTTASSVVTTNTTHPVGAITSIAVTPISPPNLKTGFSQDFVATATYSDGSTDTITGQATWASSDSTIAAFLQAGSLLTGMKPGNVTITASLGGKTSPPVSITVIQMSIF
jgi:hypothetical protein